MLRKQQSMDRYIAAICASPALVLAPHGFLSGGRQATCYPSMRDRLPDATSAHMKVVVDRNISKQAIYK